MASLDRRTGRRWLPLILLLAVVCFFALLPVSSVASVDPFLDEHIKALEVKVRSWENNGHIVSWLIFSVFFLGLAVAALQMAKTRAMKVTAAVLSFLSAVIVGFYHQFFPADDRTYDKAARQARYRLEAFIRQLAQYPTLDEATKTSLHKEFEQLIKAVEQIEETTIHGAPGVAEQAGLNQGLTLVPSAHAQPNADHSPETPAWVKKKPHDDRNLYFFGSAKGQTFEEARQSALNDARNSALREFKNRAMASPSLAGNPQLIDQIVKALTDSAEVLDTFTVPTNLFGYKYYSAVLLVLPRNAARFTGESIFVKAGVAYDEPFLDGLQK